MQQYTTNQETSLTSIKEHVNLINNQVDNNESLNTLQTVEIKSKRIQIMKEDNLRIKDQIQKSIVISDVQVREYIQTANRVLFTNDKTFNDDQSMQFFIDQLFGTRRGGLNVIIRPKLTP